MKDINYFELEVSKHLMSMLLLHKFPRHVFLLQEKLKWFGSSSTHIIGQHNFRFSLCCSNLLFLSSFPEGGATSSEVLPSSPLQPDTRALISQPTHPMDKQLFTVSKSLPHIVSMGLRTPRGSQGFDVLQQAKNGSTYSPSLQTFPANFSVNDCFVTITIYQKKNNAWN